MTVNLFAGMGSHQSSRSKTNSWFTPPPIIEALGGAESFDLDPATQDDRPWPTARHHYTPRDNGLTSPWFGRVWLNPPYSTALLSRFMARMAAHGRGVALIFARTDTDAFYRHIWETATGILFLRGRLTFYRANGKPARKNGGAPSVLIAYGNEDRDILSAVPVSGHFVPLRLPVSFLVTAIEQTWKEALESFFARHDGPVALADLYRAFADHPKTRGNQHWRDKLRQVLQRGQYERVAKGTWQRIAA